MRTDCSFFLMALLSCFFIIHNCTHLTLRTTCYVPSTFLYLCLCFYNIWFTVYFQVIFTYFLRNCYIDIAVHSRVNHYTDWHGGYISENFSFHKPCTYTSQNHSQKEKPSYRSMRCAIHLSKQITPGSHPEQKIFQIYHYN